MDESTDTRVRLLEVARAVFAEKGLAGARTRDICALAKTNIAAVNYHFGSKELLYLRVLVEHIREAQERHPHDAGITPESTPQERMRAFLHSMLYMLLSNNDEHYVCLSKLFLLEMLTPSGSVQMLLDEFITPTNATLWSIVAEMMPGVSDSVITQCVASIMSQFTMFCFDAKILASLGPGFPINEERAMQLFDVMMDFVMGGIERVRVNNTL